MRIAVDVCVGTRGIAKLRAAGHRVMGAEHGEPDREANPRGDENEIRGALRNLRHLYEMMLVPGIVADTAKAARGLLGPSIERLERFETKMTAALRKDMSK